MSQFRKHFNESDTADQLFTSYAVKWPDRSSAEAVRDVGAVLKQYGGATTTTFSSQLIASMFADIQRTDGQRQRGEIGTTEERFPEVVAEARSFCLALVEKTRLARPVALRLCRRSRLCLCL
jgi:hypothetical protein